MASGTTAPTPKHHREEVAVSCWGKSLRLQGGSSGSSQGAPGRIRAKSLGRKELLEFFTDSILSYLGSSDLVLTLKPGRPRVGKAWFRKYVGLVAASPRVLRKQFLLSEQFSSVNRGVLQSILQGKFRGFSAWRSDSVRHSFLEGRDLDSPLPL